MNEKSVLISLGDSRLKQISEVMGNKTCNKILEFLGDRDGTVSDISNELKIPINTADYNVKKLIQTGLIEKSSYFWSTKGKKMPIYRISNKKIIISPKKSRNVVSMILALGFTGIIAIILKKVTLTTELLYQNIPVTLRESGTLTLKAADATSEAVSVPSIFTSIASWEWFLIGAWFAIALFFVLSIIDERRKTK
ncbi:MAG: helix-turn-helix domain-containing protein [Candidatus Pacearchaeota archaeon]